MSLLARANHVRRTLGIYLRRTARRMHPTKLVMLGYVSYMVAGWLALSLPWAQQGAGVKAIDNLFTAVSAVSTTGLATVSTADDYSLFGQIAVLLLIQLGGIGYMTLGSFLVLTRSPDLSGVRLGVARTVFSIPDSFRMEKFIPSVVKFSLAIELLGAAALYILFRKAGTPHPLWNSVFHSVSAFCTAGFSLSNSSFAPFAGDFWMNAVLAALSYLGAIGFIVCVDAWRMATGKVREMTLTSKVILWSTFWLSVAGTLLIFLGEPSIQARPLGERLLAAFFQAMAALTTVGFNTVDIGQISKASVLVLTVLMVIGASPSGTGGGLKCTTFSAVLGVMRSAIRGEHEVKFWGRPVPIGRLWIAVASLGFYLAALIIGTYLLEATETTPFDQNLFEVASALGTVGLSMGITSSLSAVGKVIVILLMFCGRLGPLTLGMALLHRAGAAPGQGDNDLAV